ncbi:hypothetical protein E4Z66_01555 [Aliishimia ponticola]|uniref:Immunity MXAN-0049 protein domain-containing protein n=1 Tax=Aliishimia ponticola TaxID=2499833 RepID=A0A4S4NFC8_9RHOB|nr:DUF1629 domain-containing protein [Aliishimia ponticola]THH38284.1 hypothetical protein E4Z66_01555 [Aliishimia ponticola]
MTHIFDLRLHKVQIPTEMREWEERFPVGSPNVDQSITDRGLNAVHCWRDAKGPNNAEDMPKVLLAERARKTWPDAFTTTNGLYVVSGAAKHVIEGLDPGIHQFFPLKIQTKRGIDIPGPWFAMNVHVKQDSIVMEKSRVNKSQRKPDELSRFWGDTKDGDVVVDPAKQSGIHLWREARFIGSLLASDELIAAFKVQGVKFFPSFKATNISELSEG